LVSAWNCVSVTHDSLEASLASYHSQVSELAEELLVARSYFENDPDYWVGSGLVSDSAAETLFSRLPKLPVVFKRVSLLRMLPLNYSTLISPLSRPFARGFFFLNLMVIFLIL